MENFFSSIPFDKVAQFLFLSWIWIFLHLEAKQLLLLVWLQSFKGIQDKPNTLKSILISKPLLISLYLFCF